MPPADDEDEAALIDSLFSPGGFLDAAFLDAQQEEEEVEEEEISTFLPPGIFPFVPQTQASVQPLIPARNPWADSQEDIASNEDFVPASQENFVPAFSAPAPASYGPDSLYYVPPDATPSPNRNAALLGPQPQQPQQPHVYDLSPHAKSFTPQAFTMNEVEERTPIVEEEMNEESQPIQIPEIEDDTLPESWHQRRGEDDIRSVDPSEADSLVSKDLDFGEEGEDCARKLEPLLVDAQGSDDGDHDEVYDDDDGGDCDDGDDEDIQSQSTDPNQSTDIDEEEDDESRNETSVSSSDHHTDDFENERHEDRAPLERSVHTSPVPKREAIEPTLTPPVDQPPLPFPMDEKHEEDTDTTIQTDLHTQCGKSEPPRGATGGFIDFFTACVVVAIDIPGRIGNAIINTRDRFFSAIYNLFSCLFEYAKMRLKHVLYAYESFISWNRSWTQAVQRLYTTSVLPTFTIVFESMLAIVVLVTTMLWTVLVYSVYQTIEEVDTGICYAVFYFLPSACYAAMDWINLPHWTPHLATTAAVFALCNQVPSGPVLTTILKPKDEDIDPKPTDEDRSRHRQRSTGSNHYRDRLSTRNPNATNDIRTRDERACRTILKVLRSVLPFFFLLLSDETSVMGASGSSRLTTAFMMSLVRRCLISSPIAWVSWALQVLLATHFRHAVVDFAILVLGLSSMRLMRYLSSVPIQPKPASATGGTSSGGGARR